MRALHVTSAAELGLALIHLLEIVVIQGIWLTLGKVSLSVNVPTTLNEQCPHPNPSPQAWRQLTCLSLWASFPLSIYFCFVFWLLEISHTLWMDYIYIYILINIFFNHFKWMHNYCMDVWVFIHLPIELFDFSQLEITFG